MLTKEYMNILMALYNVTEEIALTLKYKLLTLNTKLLQGYFCCQALHKTKINFVIMLDKKEEMYLKHIIKAYLEEVMSKENKPLSFYYNYAVPTAFLSMHSKEKKIISLRVYIKISPSLTNKDFLRYHEVLYKLNYQEQSIENFFLHSVNLT